MFRTPTAVVHRALALLSVPLAAVTLAACASTVSTTAFKGTAHDVAQTVSNLQADATASEDKKICTNDLAAATVARLGGTKSCEAAIKKQLAEVDSLTVSVQSIQLAPGAKTASAHVKSIYQGKSAATTITLVKENAGWKISGL